MQRRLHRWRLARLHGLRRARVDSEGEKVMAHTVTKYRCDHCEREYTSKKGAEQHEQKCFYVDANRACVTCAHLIAASKTHGDIEDSEVTVQVQCNIDLDVIDIDEIFGSERQRSYQANCDGWEKRTAEGTYKFGRTLIEEV
jgi:hypothetical protein